MLREELHELEWKDHLQGDFKYSDKFCKRVDFLFCSEKLGERAGKQLELISKMRTILKEYSVNYSSLSSFSLDSFNSPVFAGADAVCS